MTQYVIIIDGHAMDSIPDEDMTAVANAAHAVCQQAIRAGVYVSADGLGNQPASIVAPGTRRPLTDSRSSTCPHARRRWPGLPSSPVACRCPQEVRETGFDPELDAMLRQAQSRRRRPDEV